MRLKTQILSLTTLAVLGAASLQSCNPKRAHAYNARTNVDPNGMAFIKEAHEGGLTEIGASKLALKNSTNKEVTNLATMIIKDHSEAAADIDILADNKYVFLRDTMNLEHKIMVDTLAKKSGVEFDKAYVEMMVKDHEEASELFKENIGSTYTDIAEVAKKYYSKIEEHKKMAEDLKKKLK